MSHYPLLRMRRLRSDSAIRRMVEENALSVNDFIWPLFVHDELQNQPILSLPGISRLSFDSLYREAEKACALKIPFIAVFPVIPSDKKDGTAKEALNEEGLVTRAIMQVKKRFPELGVMADIALDPYTDHGHDGIIDAGGRILNDETVDLLRQQALIYAAAGVDIVAPSDMMDGRIGVIRQALESKNFTDVKILSYAAKYASHFYGPFRDAVGSSTTLGEKDKTSYQMNPANRREAMREIQLDVNEGADMVMIKPGMPYLDIVYEAVQSFNLPIFAYQVSGEYAMLCAAADNGWLCRDKVMMESLVAFKRAGASGVLTYFAPTAAQLLAAAH